MASGDRFYMMELRHRSALHGDVGSLLKIEGLVIGGEGAQAVMLLPHVAEFPSVDSLRRDGRLLTPTIEEWTDWLMRSDQPEILVQGSLEKVFHRKVRYDISGHVQQKIWVADGCKCMYCGLPMGKVQLTIDHFVPLEMGGTNDTSNYLSACRKCNKDKGGMAPKEWLESRPVKMTLAQVHRVAFAYDFYVQYLADRVIN